jgi:chemotaxis signal transduction protein
MSDVPETSAATMRQAFDEGFGLPLVSDAQIREDFLLIRLHQQAHALRLSEILGLRAGGWITPVPGSPPEMLGLAGHKGSILPVYDLAVLLGFPAGSAGRWQVATREPELILSIEHFDRHLRCSLDAIAPLHQDGQQHIVAQLRTAQGHCPVISVHAVLNTIQNKARVARQER